MSTELLIEETSSHERLIDERTIAHALTEVDHLNRLRLPDGSHHPAVEAGILANLVPAVKEAAIPRAVSTVYQQKRGEKFWWLDQTSEDVAASGYKFHEHPVALQRVAIEVEEDADVCINLQPGYVKILISPRLTPYEASRQIAEQEHLADDDMVRIHWLDTDDSGRVVGKYMQSILVRDVPLAAWNGLLADQDTLLDKPIITTDPHASRSVMEAHAKMHIPADRLINGVVDVIAAVVPHVRAIDPEAARSVEAQLLLFTSDQETLHEQATTIARRWLAFEKQLADSMYYGSATPAIMQFIESVEDQCSNDFLELLRRNTAYDGTLMMNAELAALMEQMRQNTLWTRAGVMTGNHRVINQLSESACRQIYDNELYLQQLMHEDIEMTVLQTIESQGNHIIAKENVNVGGGCPGSLSNLFRGKSNEQEGENGKTEVMKCVKCPLCGREGVDAHIKHEQKQKTITCSKCKQSKVYKK